MSRYDADVTRRDLLDAAERIVRRDGVAALTLDAVARQAGRSKGGVLYHFRTKEALVAGLLDELDRRFDAEVERRAAGLDGPGSWLRAYVDACLAPSAADDRYDDLTGGLLAAVATDPALLAPFRDLYRAWQARAERDGPTPAIGTIVRLAADGLWFAELFGLGAPEGTLRDEVVRELNRLAAGSSPPSDGEL